MCDALVMDIMTPGKHREKPQAQREKRVRDTITDILKQFPPKKKK